MSNENLTGYGGHVYINLKQLRENYRIIKNALPNSAKRLAVLKGNAYGHNLLGCTRVAVEEGMDYIGIVDNWEAKKLRTIDLKNCKIARLRPATEPEMREAVDYDLEELIGTAHHGRLLNKIGEERKKKLPIMIKLDVGIGRMAFYFHQIDEVIEMLTLPWLECRTIACHFPNADEKDEKITFDQLDHFHNFFEKIKSKMPSDWKVPTKSFANSAFTFRFPSKSNNSMTRVGMGQFGNTPDPLFAPLLKGMKPILEFKSSIIAIRNILKGSTVSYGSIWTAGRDSKIATVGAGYSNGVKRGHKNPCVLISGKKFPIVGKICMNVVMVDITDLKDEPKIGDEVVFLGNQGNEQITAEDLADKIEGGLSYEVTILFGSNSNNQIHLIE